MVKSSLSRGLLTTFFAAAVLAGAPSGALAAGTGGSFNCSASAISVSVLGNAALEPITANPAAATCQNAISSLTSLPTALPSPVSAAFAGAQTALQGPAGAAYAQTATATGAVGDLAIKSLPTLPIALPAAQVPSGLNAVTVPLSSALQLLLALPGSPTSIVVNVLPAAQKLIPTQALPNIDLANVHVAASTANATCVKGVPQLTGSSTVAGIAALGQALPIGQAVNQAVTLIGAQSISLSNIDLTQVQLPAGLSLSSPIYGSQLQSAIQAVVNNLPPITIPATVGQVSVTPAQQTNSNGVLTQRALEVQASILGHPIADVILGTASVADASVLCTPPAPPASAPAAGPLAASQLALQCTTRKLNLINVVERPDHVALLGAADRSLIGHTVDIVFAATGRKVATAVVRPDGFFRASAPLPPRSLRHGNMARYQAVAGGEHSLDLKLERRMHISSLRHSGKTVLISGVVSGPLASNDILIQQRVSCTQLVTVARIHPRPDGSWSAVVPAPAAGQAAVYRAATEVLNNPNSSKKFPTFTLPGFVSL